MTIPSDDERAMSLVQAIRSGDVPGLERQLSASPELATVRIQDRRGVCRTLAHVVADWPGHFPNGADVVATLVRAGTDIGSPVVSAPNDSAETPLHWAASSNDVAVLDALLDGGADIEAPGAIFTGGSAMSDAVVFAQWGAARRLLERGAATTFWQAAALGLLDAVRDALTHDPAPSVQERTNALWHACRGGQQEVAELLVAKGADMNWVGYDHKTALDVARESASPGLVDWLESRGAVSARG